MYKTYKDSKGLIEDFGVKRELRDRWFKSYSSNRDYSFLVNQIDNILKMFEERYRSRYEIETWLKKLGEKYDFYKLDPETLNIKVNFYLELQNRLYSDDCSTLADRDRILEELFRRELEIDAVLKQKNDQYLDIQGRYSKSGIPEKGYNILRDPVRQYGANPLELYITAVEEPDRKQISYLQFLKQVFFPTFCKQQINIYTLKLPLGLQYQLIIGVVGSAPALLYAFFTMGLGVVALSSGVGAITSLILNHLQCKSVYDKLVSMNHDIERQFLETGLHDAIVNYLATVNESEELKQGSMFVHAKFRR